MIWQSQCEARLSQSQEIVEVGTLVAVAVDDDVDIGVPTSFGGRDEARVACDSQEETTTRVPHSLRMVVEEAVLSPVSPLVAAMEVPKRPRRLLLHYYFYWT